MTIVFLEQSGLSASEFARELIGAEHGGLAASLIFVDAEPGQGPSLHRHPYAEVLIILDGQATFSDGQSERTARAGEIVIVPAGQPHAFVNTGTSRLRQIDIHLSPEFVTEWLDRT